MIMEKRYKIGEVVNILSEEYPDMTASAIRYWEGEYLLIPDSKTKGGQRLYTETDIELLKYIKELSRCEYSIKKIREEISKCQKPAEDTEHLIRIVSYVKRQVTIARYIRLYFQLTKMEKTEPTYTRADLVKILRSEIARKVINKAIKYKLILPLKINRKLLFTAYDEIILRIIIYVDENLKEGIGDWERFIEMCRGIYDACRTLHSFIFGELQLTIKDYTQEYMGNILFNIIMDRLTPEKIDINKWKKFRILTRAG